jgi:hypothetical protein
MNAYLRTLPLPGAVRPVREHGASALDRAVTAWPAPDPVARVLDSRSAPTAAAVVLTGLSPWPAPDPVMRFDLSAPQLRRAVAPVDGRIPWTDLVEPRYTVPVPDLQSASRAAIAPPTEVIAPSTEVIYRQVWAAPTLADAAPTEFTEPDRSRTSNRWVAGLAAAAGTLAVGATALIALF